VISKNNILLLRIPFSLYLMPVFLLALSQAVNIQPASAVAAFILIHLFIYPSSNGYNSYIDQDEGSVGGLEHPPKGDKALFYLSVFMDTLAILLAIFLVNAIFAICLLVYVLASRAYSAPQTRLKKYAFAGFATVVFFQGAFTYFFALIGITGQIPELNANFLLPASAASLQIAGAYPLTQIYQHQEDYKNGVITISYKLGLQGTFFFTGMMFMCCDLCYFLFFRLNERLADFLLLQLFFVPVIIYFNIWYLRVRKNPLAADFRHTMRMNTIASVCMSACFILLFIRSLF
jgi:1,4-dihydroxy-2-naphthoate octaprenyltransferase